MKRILVVFGLIVVLGSLAVSSGESRQAPNRKPKANSPPALADAMRRWLTPPTPVIDSYFPLFGPPGTVVTIYGSGFGQTKGDSYVAALNISTNTYTEWASNSWSERQIVVVVPSSMPLGKIYFVVEVAEVHTLGWYPFTVGIPPMIKTYASYGNPGTLLTISGTGFGSLQGGGQVSVLGAATDIWTTWRASVWSDTEIVVEIPADMPLGQVFLNVLANNLWSIGPDRFTVGTPPAVTGYSPLYGEPGTVLTISGKGFGQPDSNSYVAVLSPVTHSYVDWPTTSWTDTEIAVSVPTTMSLGKVYLTVIAGGLQSIGTYPFTVGVPPTITSYSPSSGGPGTILTIRGSGFGAFQGSGYVYAYTISGTKWPVKRWNDSEIVVSVPSDAMSGRIFLSVVADGLQSIGTYPFQIL